MTHLTQARLKELLDYDPKTGLFFWRARAGRRSPGEQAGCELRKRAGDAPYWAIRVDGKLYQNAARLAWLYMEGILPEPQIDHINRCRCDNRWTNLRLATPSQNQANKNIRSDNKSGETGVFFNGDRGRWQATISIAGKTKNLGRFQDRAAAQSAYESAAAKYHGEFVPR